MYKLRTRGNLHFGYSVIMRLICMQVEGQHLQTGMEKLIAVLHALLHAHHPTQIHSR